METKITVLELARLGAAMYSRSGGDVRQAIRYAQELVEEAERVLWLAQEKRDHPESAKGAEERKAGGVMTTDSMKSALYG
jgi:hypothetical protein